jgi:hypothetical protein
MNLDGNQPIKNNRVTSSDGIAYDVLNLKFLGNSKIHETFPGANLPVTGFVVSSTGALNVTKYISGTVTHEGVANSEGLPLTIEFWRGLNYFGKISVTLGSAGVFSTSTTVPYGPYKLILKSGAPFLNKAVSNVSISATSATGVTGLLFTGDVNGDGVVGEFEIAGNVEFNGKTSGDGDWNTVITTGPFKGYKPSQFDVDGDGEIGPGDTDNNGKVHDTP